MSVPGYFRNLNNLPYAATNQMEKSDTNASCAAHIINSTTASTMQTTSLILEEWV